MARKNVGAAGASLGAAGDAFIRAFINLPAEARAGAVAAVTHLNAVLSVDVDPAMPRRRAAKGSGGGRASEGA